MLLINNSPYINSRSGVGGGKETRSIDSSYHGPTNSLRLLSNNSNNLSYMPYSVVAGSNSAKNKRLSVSSNRKEKAEDSTNNSMMQPDVRQLYSKSFLSIIGNNSSLTNEASS